MKDKIFGYVVCVAIVLWFSWGLIDTFGGLDNVKLIGDGSLLIGFLKLPFCLFGGVQLLRGICSVIGKDAKEMEDSGITSYLVFVLYLLATIGGIVFFVDAYLLFN